MASPQDIPETADRPRQQDPLQSISARAMRAWSLWVLPLIHVIISASTRCTRALLRQVLGAQTVCAILPARGAEPSAIWRWQVLLRPATSHCSTARRTHSIEAAF